MTSTKLLSCRPLCSQFKLAHPTDASERKHPNFATIAWNLGRGWGLRITRRGNCATRALAVPGVPGGFRRTSMLDSWCRKCSPEAHGVPLRTDKPRRQKFLERSQESHPAPAALPKDGRL